MRGNVTSFALPWTDILRELSGMDSGEFGCALPRTGAELADTVQVLIRRGSWQQETTAQSLLHHARVRRRVVLDLLRGAVRRGHRGYSLLDWAETERRAALLPEDGIPPEVTKLLDPDRHFTQLRPDKAADPAEPGEHDSAAIAAQLADMRPHAVMLEYSGNVEGDTQAKAGTAWSAVAAQVRGDEENEASHKQLNITVGDRPVDQFKPLYMAVAFCWCFKFSVGLPDVLWKDTVTRDRRDALAPVVDIATWCQQMARRVESQFARDWLFMFAAWNQCFRQAVNRSRTLYSYTPRAEAPMTKEELTEGAVALCAALKGKYRPFPGGPLQPVNGDLAKVGLVETLSRVARRMLENVRHTSQQIPGTVETRRLMRHETHAYRIVFGEPIFVTISPAERDSFLTAKLFRVRASDPICRLDPAAASWGGRFRPKLGVDLEEDEVAEVDVPDFQARRHIAACDPLASVEAFHVQLRLVLRHIFGVEFCVDCPNCDQCCTDTPSASAAVWGAGAFGRVSAVYACLEHQKSAALHAHMQVFVECLHQHTPLKDILQLAKGSQGKGVAGAVSTIQVSCRRRNVPRSSTGRPTSGLCRSKLAPAQAGAQFDLLA